MKEKVVTDIEKNKNKAEKTNQETTSTTTPPNTPPKPEEVPAVTEEGQSKKKEENNNNGGNEGFSMNKINSAAKAPIQVKRKDYNPERAKVEANYEKRSKKLVKLREKLIKEEQDIAQKEQEEAQLGSNGKPKGRSFLSKIFGFRGKKAKLMTNKQLEKMKSDNLSKIDFREKRRRAAEDSAEAKKAGTLVEGEETKYTEGDTKLPDIVKNTGSSDTSSKNTTEAPKNITGAPVKPQKPLTPAQQSNLKQANATENSRPKTPLIANFSENAKTKAQSVNSEQNKRATERKTLANAENAEIRQTKLTALGNSRKAQRAKKEKNITNTSSAKQKETQNAMLFGGYKSKRNNRNIQRKTKKKIQ